MSLELPVLRLGVAGFSAEQQQRLMTQLAGAGPARMAWEIGVFGDSDVWCINGARTQLLADGTLRVASGVTAGRSIQLNLQEVDRPLAFTLPLAPRQFEPEFTFDPTQPDSLDRLLARLETWLSPLVAQFCLASQILEHETILGACIYRVTAADGTLLAVVNLRGDVGVLPTALPLDFEHAMWNACSGADALIPEGFVRSSLSRLMWQYAVRTTRDVLPKRYRSNVLYFRRPPRLPQRLLRDTHLLLLRELASAPATFDELQERTGLAAELLAQELGALYLVGAITSNAKRADPLGARRHEAGDSSHNSLPHSVVPSGLESDAAAGRVRSRRQDLTAPAPLSFG